MGEEKMNAQIPDGWTFTDADRELAARLQQRLPARIFDVHMHLYRIDDLEPCSLMATWGPGTVDLGVWRRCVGEQLGAERLVGALVTPTPSRGGSRGIANEFVLAEVEGKREFRANVLISPQDDPARIETYLRNPQVVGFKPYHFYAGGVETFHAELDEFLPEWAWQMADERGLLILLHMVKDGALADPANRAAIIRRCLQYPNARLVLAHAARGFHAPNTTGSIAELRGLQNVWFDMAAVCEPEAMAAILEQFGPRRLMFGTDFQVSQQRGRCVTLGTGFTWVTTDQVEWNERAFFGQPVLVGLESVQALLGAVDALGLNETDVQDIFCDNALRLLGMADETADQTQALYRHAKERIPGGTQLLSKRPEMFAPDQWPAYFREARGCEVWDMDGRHYYDLSVTGISATLLGYRDPDVTRAVQRRLALGSFCTLNSPDEVELADLLCELHPWAEQVRYARTGGEIMSIAVRIARATTDRSAVAICGYHGWHDWYLAANLGEDDSLRGHLLPGLDPLGVPVELRDTNFPFTFNNREELDNILNAQGDRLAAVVMEPCRHQDPEPGFLEYVRDAAHRVGALLIFDEITIGWRLVCGGAHLRFGVNPDIAVFAKSIGNGHPMAAVIGTREAMEGAHTSFISSTYWTEGVGPAAALAAVRKMRRLAVPAHCARIGKRLQQLWRTLGADHDLPLSVPDHYPALPHFVFEGDRSQQLKTLFVQLMLERGFLANPAVSVNLSHTPEIVDRYEEAVARAFAEIADALKKGDVEQRLRGPVAHTGFRRLL